MGSTSCRGGMRLIRKDYKEETLNTISPWDDAATGGGRWLSGKGIMGGRV